MKFNFDFKKYLGRPVGMDEQGIPMSEEIPQEGVVARVEGGEVVDDLKEKQLLQEIDDLRIAYKQALQDSPNVDESALYEQLMQDHPGASAEEIQALMEDAMFDQEDRTNEVADSIQQDIRDAQMRLEEYRKQRDAGLDEGKEAA